MTTNPEEEAIPGPSGVVETLRDQVAKFQEGRGVPRSDYSFVVLMAAIVNMVSQAVHSVLSLMLSLAPVSEVGLHVVRFILESIIRLKRATSFTEMLQKGVVILLQMGLAFGLVTFIFGSILYPVFSMGLGVTMKFAGFLTGRGLLFIL